MPECMPPQPDQPYVLNGVATGMTQHDWKSPPYREVKCPCGWGSNLAERVSDSLGLQMMAEMRSDAAGHHSTCEKARSTWVMPEPRVRLEDIVAAAPWAEPKNPWWRRWLGRHP